MTQEKVKADSNSDTGYETWRQINVEHIFIKILYISKRKIHFSMVDV
jgi:hypothetical protein